MGKKFFWFRLIGLLPLLALVLILFGKNYWSTPHAPNLRPVIVEESGAADGSDESPMPPQQNGIPLGKGERQTLESWHHLQKGESPREVPPLYQLEPVPSSTESDPADQPPALRLKGSGKK